MTPRTLNLSAVVGRRTVELEAGAESVAVVVTREDGSVVRWAEPLPMMARIAVPQLLAWITSAAEKAGK